MKKWKNETVFEKVMTLVCSVLTLPLPYLGIISVSAIIGNGFTVETVLFLSLFLISILSMLYVSKLMDVTGSIERRKNSLDTMELRAEDKKKDADKYYESKKISADRIYDRKIAEANSFEEMKKEQVDAYVRLRKESAKDYWEKYKKKTEEEIDEYREKFEEEVEDWKMSDDTLWSIRHYEFQRYREKYGFADDLIVKSAIRTEFPFTYSATMSADYEAALLEEEEKRLIWKPRPALSAAETVSEVKRKFRQSQSELKVMLYKYEFLLTTFPELRKYVDDEKGLLSLVDAENYGDFADNYDRARDYLTDEEYSKLSVTQRNQLALDHYNARPKSNWVIGTEYEMYCEHLIRQQGYSTIDFGVRHRINDLGRDIIAKKGATTYIIQCKRWATDKEIHENVICQLYGTTIEYNIQTQKDNHNPTLFDEDLVVIPVLMTTTKVSDTAKAFADKLGVMVNVVKMGKYPQIKCNINNGNKIYHLPFDQQYYTTRIEKPGEKYAWTVEEAEKSGFRRAFRWQGNNN